MYYKLNKNDKSLLTFEKSINYDLSIDNILVDSAYCIYIYSIMGKGKYRRI